MPVRSHARVLAVIPARGGSKGLPRKHLLPLGGKPLIAHSIAAALDAQACSRVIVSTDSEEIAGVARAHGAEVPWLRPAELATDDAPSSAVLRHALLACEREEGARYDLVMLLQPTSPLRSAKDIVAALELQRTSKAPAVIGVCELEHPLAWTVTLETGGAIVPHPVAQGVDLRKGRQQQATAYRYSGAIYIWTRDTALADREGLAPGTLGFVMPRERSVDIDTWIDYELACALFARAAGART